MEAELEKGRNRKGVNRCCNVLPQVSDLDEQGRGQSWGIRVRLRGRLTANRTNQTSHVEEEESDQKNCETAVTNPQQLHTHLKPFSPEGATTP